MDGKSQEEKFADSPGKKFKLPKMVIDCFAADQNLPISLLQLAKSGQEMARIGQNGQIWAKSPEMAKMIR